MDYQVIIWGVINFFLKLLAVYMAYFLGGYLAENYNKKRAWFGYIQIVIIMYVIAFFYWGFIGTCTETEDGYYDCPEHTYTSQEKYNYAVPVFIIGSIVAMAGYYKKIQKIKIKKITDAIGEIDKAIETIKHDSDRKV